MRQDNYFAKDDLQNSLHLKDKSRWLTGFYKLIAQIIWQNQTYNTEALMKKSIKFILHLPSGISIAKASQMAPVHLVLSSGRFWAEPTSPDMIAPPQCNSSPSQAKFGSLWLVATLIHSPVSEPGCLYLYHHWLLGKWQSW